jgi:hypothetical protein
MRVTESLRMALPLDDAMKKTLLLIVIAFGCALQDRSIGDEIENMGAASDEEGASGNMGPAESSSGGEPAGVRVGAVLGSDGLCPFQFGKAFALTLQFTPGSAVCKALLEDELIAAGDAPTWYIWLGVPLAETGVYDFSLDEDNDLIAIIDAAEGGGGSMGDFNAGTIEITAIDSTGVTGTISGVTEFSLANVAIDINGPFIATWCSEAEWLDIDFDPANEPVEGFDPACKIPGT